MTNIPTLRDIEQAAARLTGVSRLTPLIKSDGAGNALLKCEHLQRSQAYKFRGIFNRIAAVTENERSNGIAIVSSGNAGISASIAAGIFGVPCNVFVARTAVARKLESIERAGGSVVKCDSVAAAFDAAHAWTDENGAAFVHPFDHRDVIAGQGTVALEVLQQMDDLECIAVPTSGGGLLAGTVLAIRSLRPNVRIIAVEPRGGEKLGDSLTRSEIVTRTEVSTIADALTYPGYGELNFEMVQGQVDEVVVVDDDQMLGSMRSTWENYGMVVEPAAAAALAALRAVGADSATSVAIMSGGNVDPELFSHAARGGTAAQWHALQRGK